MGLAQECLILCQRGQSFGILLHESWLPLQHSRFSSLTLKPLFSSPGYNRQKALEQFAKGGCIVFILGCFKTRLDKILSSLLWPWSWPCFEPEVKLETFWGPLQPRLSYDSNTICMYYWSKTSEQQNMVKQDGWFSNSGYARPQLGLLLSTPTTYSNQKSKSWFQV